MKKRLFLSILTFCLFLIPKSSLADKDKIANLKTELKSVTGVDRYETLSSISKEYMFSSFILAEKYARIGLKESTKSKDTSYQINFYRLIGATKHLSSQYDSSLFYYQKSADIADIMNDDYERALSNLGMANILFLKGKNERAISIYKNSVEALVEKKDTHSLVITYNNLSSVYISLNVLDSAIFYVQKTLTLTFATQNTVMQATATTNLGEIYQLQSEFGKAEIEYKKAMVLFDELQSTYNIAYICIKLSELYQNTNQNELSELYLHRAVELSEKVGALELKSSAFAKLSELFERNNNYENALEFYKKHKFLSDSINKINQSTLIEEVNNAFQIEEQEHALELLNNEIELKKSRITLLYTLVSFFSFIIFIIIFAYVRINKKNKELFKQSLKEIELVEQPSKIIDAKDDELYSLIMEQFEQKKVYLNSDLTMSKLSELVNSNNNYVSKCINQRYSVNFNSVLNMYRVKEAKILFRQNALDNYTMAAIGEMCGFTSISVFNRSFKKETGITPTFFVKSLKDDTHKPI